MELRRFDDGQSFCSLRKPNETRKNSSLQVRRNPIRTAQIRRTADYIRVRLIIRSVADQEPKTNRSFLRG